MEVDVLNAGEIYRTTYHGPYGENYANILNVVLNVIFNEDGSGQIAEGSYYPTEELDEASCTADIAILPIIDNLLYTSDLDAALTIPSSNILGTIYDGVHDHPSDGYTGGVLIHADEISGSISLITSLNFDSFPSTPMHPTLCDDAANCFDVILENGETILGGNPLPGFAGGYVLKGELPSIAPNENEGADLYLEWHAIDGPISGSGLGDVIGEDEDGDGTDFDRIWSVETLVVTRLSPSAECGFNFPIFGDVTAQITNMGLGNCIDSVDEGIEGYVYSENTAYGNLVTYNSLIGEGNDDSDHDYNGTDGRIVMEFEPKCIQDINVRHLMLEFNEVGDCTAMGDLNGDDGWNVLDIVTLANCVLASNCPDLAHGCAGDMNGDGGWNVLDIVALANCVLLNNCGDR